MVANFLTARWLRSILALLALAGFAMLGGCGGGSGAPNNPFAPVPAPPTPVVFLPPVATVFSNTPATLIVEGGVPPYFVVSSNSAILPVAQSATAGVVVLLPVNVVADTPVILTAQDSIGQTGTAAITVKPAPIFNTLVVTPSNADCGANAVCSGETATASVTVTGPGGAGIPNRQVKFEVVTGAFSIQSNDPAHPLVTTLTVVTDVNGVARVILQADAGVPTQPALIRATDLQTGNQQTAQFTIVQTINGSAVLSVIPPSVTFTGHFTTDCTTGFRADYYIFGGKPPYQVAVTPAVPIIVFLTNVPVTVEGGFFSAITNGNCGTVTFVITDAQGLQTTATLSNQPGTAVVPPPTPPAALQVLPPTVSDAACMGKTFTFVIVGGTPSYNVTSTSGTVTPPSVASEGGTFTISGLTNPPSGTSNITSVVVVDNGSPKQAKTATITCSTP